MARSFASVSFASNRRSDTHNPLPGHLSGLPAQSSAAAELTSDGRAGQRDGGRTAEARWARSGVRNSRHGGIWQLLA